MASSAGPRAGFPANTTSPYSFGTPSSSHLRSSGLVISARSPRCRELITTCAPSASNSAAVMDPRPPAPPESRISSPLIVEFSGGNDRRLSRHIAETDHGQKQREHFAVAQVVLQEAFGENR